MPSLRAFGRRWEVASDDFVFPCMAEAVLRLLWFIVGFAIFSFYVDYGSCSDGRNLRLYVVVLLAINATIIVLCVATSFVSSRGKMSNEAPRRGIPLLLVLRSVVFVVETGWNIAGTVWAVGDIKTCRGTALLAIQMTVVLNWCVIVSFFAGFLAVVSPLGSQPASSGRRRHQQGGHNLDREGAKRIWKRRLRMALFCASAVDDNAKAAFEDVADLMGTFFEDTDLVMSDVWAGIILLVNERNLADESGNVSGALDRSLHPAEPIIAPPSISGRPDWMNIVLASRMMEFSLGVYGWPYYVWNNLGCRSFCRLLKKMRCCHRCRCDQVLVVRDNCCQCNTAAFLLSTNTEQTDVFFASFHNSIYEVPFVAAGDRQTESIVVAIRGSMSLRDVVTDLCANDDTLRLEPDAGDDVRCRSLTNSVGRRVHRGMLRSARHVCQLLENQKTLEDLFCLYPDYELIITGHSLGAGVAAIVALLLKPKYPKVRCFAFSPPGCVVSEDLLAECNESICSIVVADDLVPRLSVQSMQRLKAGVVEAVQHCEKPKYEILLEGCFKLICGPPYGSSSQSDADLSQDTESGAYTNSEFDFAPPDPTAAAETNNQSVRPSANQPLLTPPLVLDYGTDDETSTESVTAGRNELHLPGRVMHLLPPIEDEETETKDNNPFSVDWTDYRRFSKLKLSSRMVTDHLPHTVLTILKETAMMEENRVSG